MNRYIKIIISHPSPIKFILSKLLILLRLNNLFKIHRNGYSLHFFNSSISQNLWVDSSSRVNDEIFFKDYLKISDFVVDVGANIGNLSLFAAMITKDYDSVYSIEFNPRIFNFLVKNIRLNQLEKVIKPYQIALGNVNGLTGLSNEKNDGMISVDFNNTSHIEMKKLESIISTKRKIDFLKIDVEGFELQVLEGALENLINIEAVYFEYNSIYANKFGYRFEDIYNLLKAKDFNIFLLDVELKSLRKIKPNWNQIGTYNFLAYNSRNNIRVRLPEYREVIL